jgi:hypothetical protein
MDQVEGTEVAKSLYLESLTTPPSAPLALENVFVDLNLGLCFQLLKPISKKLLLFLES